MEQRNRFDRASQLERLVDSNAVNSSVYDLVVIGGGATGVGIAVDAATRNYRVALLEQHDFGKGTSSRSTKLVHGGVRYLEQGNIGLVREALHERGWLCKNAPHLAHPLPTIVPLHSQWQRVYYGLGLKAYDWLSGSLRLGPSRHLSLAETAAELPTLDTAGLCGGIRYFDGAFDDARLLVNLVQTAIESDAVCLNYAPVRELLREAGRVVGVVAVDNESGQEIRVRGRAVINATGPFADSIRRMDDPRSDAAIVPSQGIHLVFDRQFMPGESALIVPRTRDGRVIFAIPWHQHAVVGTTDTPLEAISLEPRPLAEEIDFLLETITPYWSQRPEPSDIRSVFAGIRPLVRAGDPRHTAKLARNHVIRVAESGLISVMGGKWTTYRRMAQDAVDRAIQVGGLPPIPCRTKTLAIHGRDGPRLKGHLAGYGSDGSAVARLAAADATLARPLAERLPFIEAQVVWAARQEMARTVEDVLARRVRALFLDAEAALAAAPRVAELLAGELERDGAWQAEQLRTFALTAENYRYAALCHG